MSFYDVEFDSFLPLVVVNFTTAVTYPYKINADATLFKLSTEDALILSYNTTIEMDCEASTLSCIQRWMLVFRPASCQLNGTYSMKSFYDCNEDGRCVDAIAVSNVTVEFFLVSTKLCADVSLEMPISGQLITYQDRTVT